jgi:hypothetical protein
VDDAELVALGVLEDDPIEAVLVVVCPVRRPPSASTRAAAASRSSAMRSTCRLFFDAFSSGTRWNRSVGTFPTGFRST